MAYLELRNVSKSYGNRQVLDGVDLAIDEGEFVSIVGTSASGKTTLLSVAAGLRKADRGSVFVDGTAISDFPKTASIVFQNYSLLPWFSALENVRLAVQAAFPGYSNSEQIKHSQRYLELVGLGSAINKRPGQLSGGMRQRLAVARAFAVEPKVLFLDEPFGALDALTRATLQQELAQLCSVAGKQVTTLMITNSVDEAILLSDRVFALSKGPGARLGAAVPVTLPKPRTPGLLMKDETALKLRGRIIDFLTHSSEPASHKSVPAPAVSPAPLEVRP